MIWGEAKTSLYGGRGTFIPEGFSEYKDVAFTARSPYLLVECCPGPITSNAAATPQFQWRPQRNCFLPWDFPASLPKHRVLMAEGINLRSGKIDLPPYPFVRYYFDWGVGSPLLTYVWPLIVSTASTLGAFVMRGIPKNSLMPYYT